MRRSRLHSIAKRTMVDVAIFVLLVAPFYLSALDRYRAGIYSKYGVVV